MKFFNQATQAFEFDSSQTFNEPGNYALRSAIETAVIELIKKGERNGLWQFKEQQKIVEQQVTKAVEPTPAKLAEENRSFWSRMNPFANKEKK